MQGPPILLPIPCDPVDPPAKDLPKRVRLLQSRPGPVGAGLSIGMRTSTRFTHSRATLLAAGTTYYLFLGLFSVLTLGYGLTAALGAEQLAGYITEALSEAFPGLVGGSGIDPPEQLRSIAQATSIVSAVGLLYGATGAVLAASRSLHAVYGAPENTRNFVRVRLCALGWVLVLAPLVLLSFVSASFTSDLSGRLLAALGIERGGSTLLLGAAALVLTIRGDGRIRRSDRAVEVPGHMRSAEPCSLLLLSDRHPRPFRVSGRHHGPSVNRNLPQSPV